ncbi:YkvI family membrane protein [Desulfofundulus thermosubterraneus]|uniref:Uncharacterized membrane protein YkvI n=1 Tax=Desulfofundulus thermosubterraneus DSM 16057 TaxID=1121432 RepID=A0A1M6MIS3_9FIRM|nr:hypothetical protein [Desulfofundulus thermosubterraneus]SHJ83250.1 Uncharacterized membrane protein YkvI [Desulfofundulus thermosubterraneus DSM 16057]
MKKALSIAGAYIGIVVGAGFVSGQEILQFFTWFGWWGILGGLIATFLFCFYGVQLLELGQEMQATSHKDSIYRICGPWIGAVVDWTVTFFLFGVAAVMLAGAGALFNQQFGLPTIYGSLGMLAIVLLTLLMRIERIIAAISLVTPFLMLAIIIITVYSLTGESMNLHTVGQYAKPANAAAPNWIIGAILYVSYNLAATAPMLISIGGAMKDHRLNRTGGILGGLGLGTLILLIGLSMMTILNRVEGIPMPTVFLANKIAPWLAVAMSVIILGMIYNTAVGMLYAFAARLVQPGTPAFFPVVLASGILALVSSFFGFTKLVGTVYPAMGYLGFLMMGAILLSWLRSRTRPKPDTVLGKETP